MGIDYNGRKFRPLAQASNGQVTTYTVFVYAQDGDLLTATYCGGGIRSGSMTGLVAEDGSLRFCYQHVTEDEELRSGVCLSRPEILVDGRIRLHERWQWTFGEPGGSGESTVEEIPGV